MTRTPETSDTPRSRTIAFVFPGQGSQYVGMGADLIERSPAAAGDGLAPADTVVLPASSAAAASTPKRSLRDMNFPLCSVDGNVAAVSGASRMAAPS